MGGGQRGLRRGVPRDLAEVLAEALHSRCGAGSSQVRRFAFAADLLPRTHWNVNLAYYLDHSFNATTSTRVVQLHLFM